MQQSKTKKMVIAGVAVTAATAAVASMLYLRHTPPQDPPRRELSAATVDYRMWPTNKAVSSFPDEKILDSINKTLESLTKGAMESNKMSAVVLKQPIIRWNAARGEPEMDLTVQLTGEKWVLTPPMIQFAFDTNGAPTSILYSP